jgi:cytosine/adenosine deaminase-related metal-dependent hydrolase
MPPSAYAIRARWVYPVDRPPLEGGIVTIAGGRIVSVGENTSGRPPRDLGDMALIPGLVNAHTHLEFSLLQQPLGRPGMPFADWIRQVIEFLRQSQPTSNDSAIYAGLVESQAAGVAAIGEIALRQELPQADLPVVVFRELLGLAEDRVPLLEQMASEHLSAAGAGHVGLSPHAPYTVHPRLLKRACELSVQHKMPLAMHLAESREELELLKSHSGPLVELLQSFGAWHPNALPHATRPLDYLRTLATAHHSLVIHGNYLAADEIEFAAAHRDRLSVVYCPRTHAWFGHEPYPLAAMLSTGVRMAVGTDSRASNPDLNLWAELQHIAAHHLSVSTDEILRMGTLAGAEALQLDGELGSISPGKQARLAVVAPTDGGQLFSAPQTVPL